MASFSSKFLKKRFAPYQLKTIVDRESPFVAALNQVQQGGSSVAEGCILSGPKGNSYQFQAAQAVSADAAYTFSPQGSAAITVTNTGNGASNYDEWISTYGDYHGVATVTAKAVAGSKTNMDAYLRQLNEVMESELAAFIEVGARKLLGPVGGSLGQVTNIAVGAQAGAYALAKPSDAYNFAVGMVVMFAAGDGSSSATVRGTTTAAYAYVQGVFPDGDGPNAGAHVYVGNAAFNGTLTPTVPVAGTGGTTTTQNNDFIFRLGDVAQGADLSDAQIRSYQSWVTLAAASDTKFNVSRAQDARLSGFRLPSTVSAGMSVLDRIQLLATIGRAQAGAKDATLCVVGPKTWQQLATEAQSFGQIQFTDNVKIGIKLLTIMTCNGPTQIVNDPHCVESDIWLFTQANLKLYHMDGFPCLDEGDGNEILRQAGAAGYEVRWHAFTCPTVNGKPWTMGRSDSGVSA